MNFAGKMHIVLIGTLSSQLPQIAAGKASNRTGSDRVMIFSPADINAQPTVMHYESPADDMSSSPILFNTAEKRINLEKNESNLLVPTRAKPVNVNSAPPLINDDRALPPGMTEEDLEEEEPSSEKLEN